MAGIDSYVVLMIHCDGSDASTTFTDSSSSAKTPTVTGNAQIDTAQSKFGGASGLFDGTGDYLTYADSADWDFGTGDLTVDFWVRHSSLTGTQDYVDRIIGGIDLFRIGITGGTIYWFINGAEPWGRTASGFSVDTWYHLAFVRSGTSCDVYKDGTKLGTTGTSSFDFQGTTALEIARNGWGATYFFGWLDELRISKGIARWTANFTPETSAYSAASTTKHLALLGVG